MATATKLHVLDCGAMSCDLTWLLLKPGRSIRPHTRLVSRSPRVHTVPNVSVWRVHLISQTVIQEQAIGNLPAVLEVHVIGIAVNTGVADAVALRE